MSANIPFCLVSHVRNLRCPVCYKEFVFEATEESLSRMAFKGRAVHFTFTMGTLVLLDSKCCPFIDIFVGDYISKGWRDPN